MPVGITVIFIICSLYYFHRPIDTTQTKAVAFCSGDVNPTSTAVVVLTVPLPSRAEAHPTVSDNPAQEVPLAPRALTGITSNALGKYPTEISLEYKPEPEISSSLAVRVPLIKWVI